MDTIRRMPLLVLPLIALLLGACAVAPPPAQVNPEGDSSPGDQTAAASDEEAEPTLDERWRSPFAVNSVGRTVPREPRQVSIIGADPEIEEALANLQPDQSGDDSDVSDDRTWGTAPSAATRTDPSVETRPALSATDSAADDPDRNDAPGSNGQVDSPPNFHMVRRGDTWPEIAAEYGIPMEALNAVNPDVDPGRIRTGDRLRLPPLGPGGRATTHEVGPTDSLGSIARRYSVSEERLREVNGLPSDRLRLGQTLLIPPASGDDS